MVFFPISPGWVSYVHDCILACAFIKCQSNTNYKSSMGYGIYFLVSLYLFSSLSYFFSSYFYPYISKEEYRQRILHGSQGTHAHSLLLKSIWEKWCKQWCISSVPIGDITPFAYEWKVGATQPPATTLLNFSKCSHSQRVSLNYDTIPVLQHGVFTHSSTEMFMLAILWT